MSRPKSILGLSILLLLGARPAEAACGKIVVAKGDIKIERAGKLIPAKANSEMCQGDTIVAGKDSRAKVVMEDGNELNVSPESRIALEKYESKPAENKKQVLLNVLYGKVRSSVKEKYDDKAKDGQANAFTVKTRSAVAGVRGTDFMTGYNASTQKSEVVTFSGKVDVGSPGPGGSIQNPVSVGAGQKTEAAMGQPPAPPKAVPPGELQKMNAETSASAGDTKTGDSSTAKAEGDNKDSKSEDGSGKKEDGGDKQAGNDGAKKEDGGGSKSEGGDNKQAGNDGAKKDDGGGSGPKRGPASAGDDKKDASSGDTKPAGGDTKQANGDGKGSGGGNGSGSNAGGKPALAGSGDSGGGKEGGPSSTGGPNSAGPARGPASEGGSTGSPGSGSTATAGPSPGGATSAGPVAMMPPPPPPPPPTVMMPNLPNLPPMPVIPVCEFCNGAVQSGPSKVNITVTTQ